MDSNVFVEEMMKIAEEGVKGCEDEGVRVELEREMEYISAVATGNGMDEKFSKQLEDAEKTENPYLRASEVREIAEAMLKCGQTDRAYELVKTIVDDYQREWTMIFVSGALAEAGRGDEALAVSGEIADRDCRARALAAVGKVFVKSGDERAGRVLLRAFEDAKEMKDPYDSLWVMCDIASAMPPGDEVGIFDKAVDTVHYICHTVKRASAFRAIAESMAEAGYYMVEKVLGLALESAAAIEDGVGRANSFAWVASTMKKAGDGRAEETLGRAVEEAQRIDNAEDQSRAFRWVAGALAESGDFENAVSLASRIRHEFFRYEALRDVAITLARTGEYEHVISAISSIDAPGPKVEAIKELVLLAV